MKKNLIPSKTIPVDAIMTLSVALEQIYLSIKENPETRSFWIKSLKKYTKKLNDLEL